jgi:uracil-DNA glycosylase family 4
MAPDRDQLAEHLKFFGELGVDGYRKDPPWAARADRPADPADLKVSTTYDTDRADLKVSTTYDTTTYDMTDTRSADLQVGQVGRDNGPDAVAALSAIRDDIGDCVRCKLCTLGRKQIVFGVGNPNADLMFVGEAPGRDEDIQGIPFVGRAGRKLTQIIEAIGLKREDVYIANVIKCRPPENRNPEPDEVEQCEPFLFRQVDTIRPKVIVALGTFAAKSLLKSSDSISRLRGRVYDYRGAKLVPTFHPAFLLRNPSCRREVWEDMKKVRALLNGEDVA